MSRCLAFLSLILCVSFAGCSKRPSLPTVPASGKVTLDGQPLAAATITFTTTNPDGRPANGVTDAEGRFRLKTYLGGSTGNVDGALTGDYIVMVTKYEAGSGTAPDPQAMADYTQQAKQMEEARKANKAMSPVSSAAPGQPKLLTPPKYSDPRETDLKATIKAGDNQFSFDLKSE